MLYKIRFYRTKEHPEDKDTWFEKVVRAKNECDMQWKVRDMLEHLMKNKTLVERTKIISIKKEIRDGKV